MKPVSLAPVAAALCLILVAGAEAHQLPEGAVPLEKSELCATCHPEIYKEWSDSYHAKSSLHKDPAHKAVHAKFSAYLTAQGKKPNYLCANCHAPMANKLQELMSGDATPDSNNWTESEGVGCTFCHRIEAISKGKSFDQYRLNKDGAYHVSEAQGKAPHPTAASSLFATGQVCMGCHSQYINPHEVPICVMTEEGTGNCLTCHMPQVAGGPVVGSKAGMHTSHRIPGGHDLAMLQQAAGLDLKIETTGKERTIVIKVSNSTTHTFPSTNPMRMAFVKVRAKDKSGAVIWENFKQDPLKEDKQSVFSRAFRAGERVGVPSWEAEALAFDTRLKAGETRQITYPIYSLAISEVEAELVYLLFPPKALESFGIPKDGVNDQRWSVAKKSVTL